MGGDAGVPGSFEEQVLLAVAHLGERPYGMTVRREIEERTGSDVSIGAVYATLDRLDAKGWIASGFETGDDARGGRAQGRPDHRRGCAGAATGARAPPSHGGRGSVSAPFPMGSRHEARRRWREGPRASSSGGPHPPTSSTPKTCAAPSARSGRRKDSRSPRRNSRRSASCACVTSCWRARTSRTSSCASPDPIENVDEASVASFRVVLPGYFETLRVRRVAGRLFDDRDDGAIPVAILNETTARQFFPAEDPVGRRRPCVRRGREGQPAAAPEWPVELRRTTHGRRCDAGPRWLEPHPLHRRGSRRGGGSATPRRARVPERHRPRPRGLPDPAVRSLRQPDRALSAVPSRPAGVTCRPGTG